MNECDGDAGIPSNNSHTSPYIPPSTKPPIALALVMPSGVIQYPLLRTSPHCMLLLGVFKSWSPYSWCFELSLTNPEPLHFGPISEFRTAKPQCHCRLRHNNAFHGLQGMRFRSVRHGD